MKIAIMQPYVFPYIGYFQLINAVDVFVFYDDVSFIKKGYINRNYILVNDTKTRFTIPCKAVSQYKKINQIEVDFNSKAIKKLQTTLATHYKKAPYFNDVMPLLNDFFNATKAINSIGEMALKSVKLIIDYLNIKTEIKISSIDFKESQFLKKEKRLISITITAKADIYVNAIGGKSLYTKDMFANHGIQLHFLESDEIVYKQFSDEFVPWLSIIDILMFNSKVKVQNYLNMYSLV